MEDKMKVKSGLILNKIADEYVVVSTNGLIDGMLRLNETAAFIYQLLENDISKSDAIKKMTDEYDVDVETAERDFNAILKVLSDANLIEE